MRSHGLMGSTLQGYSIGIPDTVPIKTRPGSPFEADYGHIPIPGESWYYLTLVGTGMPRDSDCGTFVSKAGACRNKPGDHKPILIPNTCGRKECPECWPTWATRASKRATDVLNGYLTAKFGPEQRALPGLDRKYILPRHVSFHPPRRVLEDLIRKVERATVRPSDFQKEFLRAFRDLSRETVEEAGGLAGVMVLHEIRLKSDRANQGADNDTDANRYRKVLDRPDWKDHIRYYPHVHVLVFGTLEGSKEFHERTGWTYRLHRVATNPEKAVYYLLSHTSAVSGLNSATYFGSCSPRRLWKIKEFRHRERQICDECIQEGVERDNAIRVIATIYQGSLVRENDNNPRKRIRHGRGAPVKWSFEEITDRHYTTVEKVGVYRFPVKGEKRPPRDLFQRASWVVEYVSDRDWEYLKATGVVPGSWFDTSPPAPPGPEENSQNSPGG